MTGQIRKLYILYLLKILEDHTDADHPLTQKEIAEIMERDYGVACERKAITRNLGNLEDMGYDVVHLDRKGYYLGSRTFEDSELRLLIDSVLASRYVPADQGKMLIDKLISQSNKYFRRQVRHVHNIERMDHGEDIQIFYTIEQISKAIEEKRKVTFFYNKYDADKKLHHTTKSKQLVNPYQIVIANGKYYLIGNVDKYSNVTHFRMDRITEPELTDEIIKPPQEVDELANGLDLPTHMAEHLYMFSGKSSWITLKVEKWGISDVIDWLGKDIHITDRGEHYEVRFKANEQSIGYWAVQFGGAVEVIEPLSLRDLVRERVEKIYEKYRD